MDSKLDEPEPIGEQDELFEYLTNAIKCKDKELFVIVRKEVDLNGAWRNYS
jgi:hypothetical protein